MVCEPEDIKPKTDKQKAAGQLDVKAELVGRARLVSDGRVRDLLKRYQRLAAQEPTPDAKEVRDREFFRVEDCLTEIVHGGVPVPGALTAYGLD